MYILDAIRLGGETREKAKKLCRDYGYDPTKIGCAILKACGYEITNNGFHLCSTDYNEFDNRDWDFI